MKNPLSTELPGLAWTEVMEPFWVVVMRSWRVPKSVDNVGW